MTTAFPKFTIQEMLESGVHFGHKEMLWNPKMEPFIYGSRNGVHIIDLQKTAGLLFKALQVLKAAGMNKKTKILFVGTKRQASDPIREAVIACGQYYVNHRWLGGMLTNWKTISRSLKRLEEMEKILEEHANPDSPVKYNKKELLDIDRKRQKIDAYLGGIRNMGGKPDLLFVIDTNKEDIAIKEATMLGIPVIAVVDTNSDLDNIDFPIPGNDDATRAIAFYCNLAAKAVLAGAREESSRYEIDSDIGTLDASIKAADLETEISEKSGTEKKEKIGMQAKKAEAISEEAVKALEEKFSAGKKTVAKKVDSDNEEKSVKAAVKKSADKDTKKKK